MKVYVKVDEEVGRKWKIVKHGEDDYVVHYYEFFKACGWRPVHMGPVEHRSKADIEWSFGIKVA